jgi:hypothetical protein
MKFIEKHVLLFYFIQVFIGIFCASVTVHYIFERNVSFTRTIVFSLLFALSMLYKKRKKQIKKLET